MAPICTRQEKEKSFVIRKRSESVKEKVGNGLILVKILVTQVSGPAFVLPLSWGPGPHR